MSFSFWLVIAGPALVLISIYLGHARNLAAARASGLPYVWIPINQTFTFWHVTNGLFLPWLKTLPRSWTHPWITFLHPDFVYYADHDFFQEIGGDVFILFSPFHLQVFVGNAEAIHEITNRRDDFRKDLRMYERLALFGPNIVTAYGSFWSYHRKLIGPSFSERNSSTIWKESLHQAQMMIAGWVERDRKVSGTIWDLKEATATLSLHVISRVSFGQRLHWPHENIYTPIKEGYTLTYKESIETVLRDVGLILLLPPWLLGKLPFSLAKKTHAAFVDWTKYQQEMHLLKVEELQAGGLREEMDIVGALVEGSRDFEKSLHKTAVHDDQQLHDGVAAQGHVLSEEEVLSNIFVLVLAGHETTGNTLFFSILFLAMHWSSQERLQKELDEIFGEVPISNWTYSTYINQLFDGMCGAVINEQLRLVPPILGIPKTTSSQSPVDLTFDGQTVTIPAGANIMLSQSIAGSNPRYWPHTSPKDLKSFRPERWLLNANGREPLTVALNDIDLGKNGLEQVDDSTTQPVTSTSLYRPPRGSYIPFSDGQRSCIGRRFAQVEALAVLTTIFKHWSVELDVSLWMSDADLGRATDDQRKEVWEKARDRAGDLLANGMSTIISLQMRKGQVPLRFVKRGFEAFKMG